MSLYQTQMCSCCTQCTHATLHAQKSPKSNTIVLATYCCGVSPFLNPDTGGGFATISSPAFAFAELPSALSTSKLTLSP